mmetsp:Transcript_25858/g.44176  ORF Transcript_25858/g.44176 Transcript_25858/m.44176 type:complete len:206 (-) Transcript_25858:172-789(-)
MVWKCTIRLMRVAECSMAKAKAEPDLTDTPMRWMVHILTVSFHPQISDILCVISLLPSFVSHSPPVCFSDAFYQLLTNTTFLALAVIKRVALFTTLLSLTNIDAFHPLPTNKSLESYYHLPSSSGFTDAARDSFNSIHLLKYSVLLCLSCHNIRPTMSDLLCLFRSILACSMPSSTIGRLTLPSKRACNKCVPLVRQSFQISLCV